LVLQVNYIELKIRAELSNTCLVTSTNKNQSYKLGGCTQSQGFNIL